MKDSTPPPDIPMTGAVSRITEEEEELEGCVEPPPKIADCIPKKMLAKRAIVINVLPYVDGAIALDWTKWYDAPTWESRGDDEISVSSQVLVSKSQFVFVQRLDCPSLEQR